MVMAMTDEAKELYPKLFEDQEVSGTHMKMQQYHVSSTDSTWSDVVLTGVLRLQKEEDAPKKDVDDIEAAIAAENQEEKDEKAAIFAYIRTDVKGLIFVETKGEGMDPIAMVQGFIKRVHETGHSKTKYAVRMQPIVATCYAGYDDICKTIKPVSCHSLTHKLLVFFQPLLLSLFSPSRFLIGSSLREREREREEREREEREREKEREKDEESGRRGEREKERDRDRDRDGGKQWNGEGGEENA